MRVQLDISIECKTRLKMLAVSSNKTMSEMAEEILTEGFERLENQGAIVPTATTKGKK